MIALAGTKADPVMVHFAAHLLRTGEEFAVIDLMDVATAGSWRISAPPQPDDVIDGAERVRLGDLTAVYVRAIYLGRTAEESARWAGLLDGFGAWLDEADLLVVNRPGAVQLNNLKPAHYAWLSSEGFRVPPSLLSADAERIGAFVAAGATVVKPVSGVRARTAELNAADLPRLARSGGPVLVQRRIVGDDVRVHVVGGEVVACRFVSDAVDYRTDKKAPRAVTEIPDELAGELVRATAAQGLSFAGWDFKVDRDGTYWCLECNPMPGYSFYDEVCEGAVSAALVTLLRAAA